jgi:hypothetical protein
MKKLKLTITAIALCFATITASATETTPSTVTKKETNKAFRSKIVSLIGSEAPSYLTDGKDVTAKLSLMLNNKNQLIVVSVNTKSGMVEEYVKGKLNYQKIKVKGLKKGEIYHVPLTIKQS